eukprot:6492785-Amphidinium_carterae.2
MDQVPTAPVPYWLRLPGVANAEGTSVDLELKAWEQSESRCLWELRRIWEAITIHGNNKKYMHGWLWERRRLLEQEFASLGLIYSDHIVGSRKSASKGRAVPAEEDLHDEWTCTSQGLLVFLQICGCALKHVKQKETCKIILGSLFDRCGRYVSLHSALHNATTSLLCGLRQPEHQHCTHLQQLLALESSGSAGHMEIWNLLFQLCPACATLKAEFSNILLALGQQISRAVPEVAYTSDPLHGSRRAIDHKDVPVKRRRIDEDYRKTVVRDTRQSLRAPSARALVRAYDGINMDKKVSEWEDRDSLQYMLAGWMLRANESFSLAVDASRLGKPAEETLVGIAVSGRGEGVWLPPQVHTGKK